MGKQFYLPHDDAGKDLWLQNFNAKVPNYAGKYGIDGTELNEIAAATLDFTFRRGALEKVATYSKAWTAYKNALRDGLPAGATSQLPAPPTLGNAPAAAPGGIFTTVAGIVSRIKGSKTYSDTDGQDLGIEGAEHRLDAATLTPEITLKPGTGGRPGFDWKKHGTDGITVYKDSGNGFAKYDMDNYPPYDDKAPIPATATTWKYKAIYMQHDEEVGQFSPVISVNVGG